MKSTFDTIFEEKIGFGKYQHGAIAIASLIHFTDGSDIMASSLILPVLQNEWQVDSTLHGLMGFIFFGGLFVGSLVSGILADRFGRRVTLMYVTISQAITSIALALAPELISFTILRGLFALLVGIMIPFGPAIASETSPTHLRGKMVVVANTFFSFGFVFSVLMAMISFNSLKSGNWRLFIFLSSLPTYILIYGTITFLKESPRFLIAKGDVEGGVNVLNEIAMINKGSSKPVTDEDKKSLDKWRKEIFHEAKQASLFELLTRTRRKITILLWMIWVNVNYVSYGMIFILPFMLVDLNMQIDTTAKEKGLIDVMIPVLAQVPSCIVAYIIIEKEHMGRKKTLIFTNAIAAVLYCWMFISQGSFLMTSTSIVRFLAQLSFNIIFPYTAELYITTLRVIGLGWGYGFGKFGASISPYITLGLYRINMFLPLLSYAVSSIIIGVCAYLIPKETRGKMLDAPEDVELTDVYVLHTKEDKEDY